ncbi:hypothetical protein VIBR0546_05109 [Vibrio brasiliensis LMG 20546]|jgi:hypothetical protein|uniref:Uncharacterized protein n=1 Tax=Vibrio brasiliensis LMG 20546 TaxID=945543 RepID=E8LVI1_9VIBR|nr:hypothetical protein VIBR0546_05109 [Vibrio brasiliensis LMG 20546]
MTVIFLQPSQDILVLSQKYGLNSQPVGHKMTKLGERLSVLEPQHKATVLISWQAQNASTLVVASDQ